MRSARLSWYRAPVRRRLFNGLTLLSLLLFVTVCVMWVRSYWSVEYLECSRPDWAVFMEYGGGQFRFEHVHATKDRDYVGSSRISFQRLDRADGPLELGMRMPGSRSYFDKWGFWVITGERWGDDHHAVFVPGWFLALLTAALPCGWVARRLRSSPLRKFGHCRRCGYDLTGNLSGVCPECGAGA